MYDKQAWERCVAFHGHACPGLAIGFKAVEAAIAELALPGDVTSSDEELVCITENDACSVDAVQCLLSCTYGKGNLIPRLRGKMAFSFFIRGTQKRVRVCLKSGIGNGMTREEEQQYILEAPYTELFTVQEPSYALPEEARIFRSAKCAICGESTGEYALRVMDGQLVCLDCYDPYQREGF